MLLESREVSLIYGLGTDEEVYALKDVDFSIDIGELVGVMGPSGSGKSSLLYVLSGLRRPMAGTVYFDDMDMESLSPEEKSEIRRRKFGFIFQKHLLIEYMNVIDNVMVACTKRNKDTEDKVLSLLDRLNISHLAYKKPCHLSEGQRQRTAIARALINEPSLILADEPTASLDHKNAMEVMEVLEEFKQKAAIVVVTHDRSILQNADRVVEMWDGAIKKVCG